MSPAAGKSSRYGDDASRDAMTDAPRAMTGRDIADDVASLFVTQTTLHAIVEAGLEPRQGAIARDGDAARRTLGCYEVVGGDASSQGARRLIAGAQRPELVYGNDPAWRAVILDVRGELVGRSMTEFDASGLDAVALRRVAASVPADFT